jgi:protein-S-isoprenylcysteine O-methyltransferase Ste14
MILCIAASICFVSFGWGMVKHFHRVGTPTRAMLATALLGVISASLQISALVHKRPPYPKIALGFYAASAVLFWWAVRVTRGKLAACGQGRTSQGIVVEGPYRYIRHPFYTSYNLTWIAGFVATGWWLLALTAILMAFIYERSAREEERGFLAGPLANEYRDYMRRAGRYAPRFNTRPGQFARSDS